MNNTTKTRAAGFRKPWTDGAKAYHEADTIADAIAGFRRVRTVKHFILTGTTDDPICSGCGETLSNDPAESENYRGNRCEYDPRTKSVVAFHYTCGWGRTLTAIANLRRYF